MQLQKNARRGQSERDRMEVGNHFQNAYRISTSYAVKTARGIGRIQTNHVQTSCSIGLKSEITMMMTTTKTHKCVEEE